MDEHLKVIIDYERELFRLRHEKWLSQDIFSARWWVLVGFLVLPCILWLLLVDKRRLQEMFTYAFATSFMAILLDEMGSTMTLWTYPVHIFPAYPRLVTVNYTLVPIIYALIYQYIPKWKSFIAANILLTLIFAFILEPILVWAKLYVLISWKHIYSVPIYFFAAVLLKWFSERIICVQFKH